MRGSRLRLANSLHRPSPRSTIRILSNSSRSLHTSLAALHSLDWMRSWYLHSQLPTLSSILRLLPLIFVDTFCFALLLTIRLLLLLLSAVIPLAYASLHPSHSFITSGMKTFPCFLLASYGMKPLSFLIPLLMILSSIVVHTPTLKPSQVRPFPIWLYHLLLPHNLSTCFPLSLMLPSLSIYLSSLLSPNNMIYHLHCPCSIYLKYSVAPMHFTLPCTFASLLRQNTIVWPPTLRYLLRGKSNLKWTLKHHDSA